MTLFANNKIGMRFMSGCVIVSLLLLVVSIATVANASDESAGSLRKTKGDVLIERSGKIIKAENGTPGLPK